MEIEVSDMPPFSLPFIKVAFGAVLTRLVNKRSDLPDRILGIVLRLGDKLQHSNCMWRVLVGVHDRPTVTLNKKLFSESDSIRAALFGQSA
ncbi:hypothetical protein FQZ97_747100 [compost metagenome]